LGLLSTLFCPVKLPYTVQLNCNRVSEHLSFAILGASTDAWSHSNISDDLLCPKILVNDLNITLFRNKPICYSVQLGFLTIAIELKYLKCLFLFRNFRNISATATFLISLMTCCAPIFYSVQLRNLNI
jgi:hypothetical protein